MTRPKMSRAEAGKILAWTEENLAGSLATWQKEIFVNMLMYPDLEFSLPEYRRG